MNYLFRDIAYQIGVSVGTVQRTFHCTLNALYEHRQNLSTCMPMCFSKEFGNKVAVIIDCFELFSETPSGTTNKVLTLWIMRSQYRYISTTKLLNSWLEFLLKGQSPFYSRVGVGALQTDIYVQTIDKVMPDRFVNSIHVVILNV